jgi:pyruvate formate lyase activating enzyme
VCKVRFNRADARGGVLGAGGVLYVPWGYTAGIQCDPVEKKPFYHAWPGALAYSFGMLGCDLHCAYCQNWVTSQALRDPAATLGAGAPRSAKPEKMVREALEQGAKLVVSTYNEPLITAEWAVAVFQEARAAGLKTAFVSNGNATPRVLDYLRPHLDLYKVDLKSFDEQHYHQLGGRLQPILDSIRRIYELGLWIEIVTLVVPTFNDSDEELKKMAAFIASVSPDIPWHVTAFHEDYKMAETESTGAATLLRAAQIGKRAGLKFVYAGNLPGAVGDWENTRCPQCNELLIERHSFKILQYRFTASGSCPKCAARIPGRWDGGFQGQKASAPYIPR